MQAEQKTSRRELLQSALGAGVVAAISALPKPAPGAYSSEAWGDLSGRFVFDGPAPERKKLTVEKDVECCGEFDIRDESLLVDERGGLANVFVYVRTKRVDICPDLARSAPDEVVLDNRDCIFKPHCMTVWYTQQAFEIVNSDPVGQNVAFNPIFDTPINVVLPVGGKHTHRFGRSQSAPVKILCNYHPWEVAYVLPKDNPYAAVSKPDGTFSIRKMPVGELEFQVWHERVGHLATEQWPRGRFTLDIQPGTNDLGVIKLSPEMFNG